MVQNFKGLKMYVVQIFLPVLFPPTLFPSLEITMWKNSTCVYSSSFLPKWYHNIWVFYTCKYISYSCIELDCMDMEWLIPKLDF